MNIEITHSLELSDKQEAMLSMHSFLNIMNVLYADFQFLQHVYKPTPCLEKSLDLCDKIIDSFKDKQKALEFVQHLTEYGVTFKNDLEDTLKNIPSTPEQADMVKESLKNLDKISHVIEVRVREIMARQETGGKWVDFEPDELENSLCQAFQAMAESSHGDFGIKFENIDRSEKDYLFNIKLPENPFKMPLIVSDVIRDLSANARKYSPIGSEFSLKLESLPGKLIIEVTDNGRGIPADEIENIINFGIRASNAKKDQTMGGGFGMTKTYFVCKQFGGRMWVDSELDKGTTVKLEIPQPS